MLIIHRNCIAYDNLNPEDLAEIQDPVMSHDEGRCWHEITDGDESLQRSLGDSYTWEELLKGDYSSEADVIVAPIALRTDIAKSLLKLGFHIQESYYAGEDRYYFKGSEAHYLKSKRGTSPGTRKAIAEVNLKRKLERLRRDLATIAREDSDRLLVQSPKLMQVVFLLQEIAEDGNQWSDRASALSEELQSLLVEQDYAEMIAERVGQVGDSFIL